MLYRILPIFLVLLFTANVHAADPRSQLRYGLMPMANYNMIHDPDGPTKDGMHFMPVSAVIIYTNISRDARLFGHIYYDWYDVSASDVNIGQKVKEFGVNLSYQWMFRIARSWRPYLGLGVGYANETFKSRYVCTSPSCQYSSNAAYPDRSVQSINALVNISSDWSITEKWDVGVDFQFEQPLNGGSTAARAGIYITY